MADIAGNEAVLCSSLRNGDVVILQNYPCMIVEKSTSKTDAKVHLVGIDILTGKKYEDTCCFNEFIELPFVKETNFEVSGGACTEKY